jgi:hypothetical protein
MTEVVQCDDGYWAVYQGEVLLFLGDFDTAMMVGREVDQVWESGSEPEIEQRESEVPAYPFLEDL